LLDVKEVEVDERSRVLWATLAGALAGGVVGYLYLTEGGRRLRDQLEPRLDDLMREMRRLQGTVQKARAAVDEGWRSLNEVVGEADRADEWQGQGQNTPF
jgi:hypothetical protein